MYQLVDATTSVTDLDDPDLARLVYRSDIKDGVDGIVNQYLDPLLGVYTPVEEVASVLNSGVVGSVDEGIQYSFEISNDRFALGDSRLVNHKTYYYMAIAYGYNMAEENASPYDVNAPDYDGRNQPYIAGRRNIKPVSAIPHFTETEANGTTLQSSYGDGVQITRIEGQGNGGYNLDLTHNTIIEILESPNHRSLNPIYKVGAGPVEITVVDPVKIPLGTYILKLENPIFTNNIITSYSKWTLIDENTNNTLASSNQDIIIGTEKYVSDLGLNIKIKQVAEPGSDPNNIDNNGLISGTIDFEDPNDRWLSGVVDRDDESPFFSLWGLNWIRSGSFTNDNDAQMSDYNQNDDPNGVFENVVQQTNVIFGGSEITGGTWAPYCFASYFNDGPGFSNTVTNSYSKIENTNSVDIVFTNDTSKWSKYRNSR